MLVREHAISLPMKEKGAQDHDHVHIFELQSDFLLPAIDVLLLLLVIRVQALVLIKDFDLSTFFVDVGEG